MPLVELVAYRRGLTIRRPVLRNKGGDELLDYYFSAGFFPEERGFVPALFISAYGSVSYETS